MPVTIGGSGPITGVTSINTSVSDTELGYLDGVTSAIQSQINANVPGMQFVTSATFTTSSSVVISGLTTSFHSYRLAIDFTASNAQNPVFLRNRAAGSSNASSYRTEMIEQYGATVSGSQNYNGDGTKWSLGMVGGTYPTLCSIVVDLVNISQTRSKSMFTRCMYVTNGGVSDQFLGSGYHDWATAADAIELLFGSGGTASGTVRLYGYKAS